MKTSLQAEPPSLKQRLPYVQYNNSKKIHNQSLKKLVFNQPPVQHSSLNNIGLLPRLQQKSKQTFSNHQKNSETSLEKNVVKWNVPNWNLKKRQKLHTEGQTSEQMTEIEDSFVSLTNKILRQEDDVKDTMFDFKKKIQQNKLIIKKEIEKKNKQNHSSIHKKEKSFMKKKRINSSRLLQDSPQFQRMSKHTLETPISRSKLQISLFKQRSLSKNNKANKFKQEIKRRQKTQMECTQEYKQQESEKVLPKRQSEGLFTDLQVMLDDRIRPEQQKSLKQQKKLRSLLSKLSKFKQKKLHSAHSITHQPPPSSTTDNLIHFQQSSTSTLSPTQQPNPNKIKRQTNYHEWNKINLSATSEVSYRKSSFQEELRRVVEYTDRNDASLEKYLVLRKELMKIGFQVQVGGGGKRGGDNNKVNQKVRDM